MPVLPQKCAQSGSSDKALFRSHYRMISVHRSGRRILSVLKLGAKTANHLHSFHGRASFYIYSDANEHYWIDCQNQRCFGWFTMLARIRLEAYCSDHAIYTVVTEVVFRSQRRGWWNRLPPLLHTSLQPHMLLLAKLRLCSFGDF